MWSFGVGRFCSRFATTSTGPSPSSATPLVPFRIVLISRRYLGVRGSGLWLGFRLDSRSATTSTSRLQDSDQSTLAVVCNPAGFQPRCEYCFDISYIFVNCTLLQSLYSRCARLTVQLFYALLSICNDLRCTLAVVCNPVGVLPSSGGWGYRGTSLINPPPSTLHPPPYTLHPSPSILRPPPSTLQP